MRIPDKKTAVVLAGLLGAMAIFLSAVAGPPQMQSAATRAAGVGPQEVVLALDPAQCKVHYTVESTLHTVHGTFNLKSGTLHFDPESGRAGGEIVVFATSGDSGNSSRDAKMHKEVLETRKYPDAVFRPTQIEGKVVRGGASEVKLHGVMLLHGVEHEMVVPVHAEFANDHWTGTVNFAVPYIEWGMKDPSNWLLKVKPVVNIELDLAGTANARN